MGMLTFAIVACSVGTAAEDAAGVRAASEARCWLVAEESLAAALADRLPPGVRMLSRTEASGGVLLEAMARGEDVVWIGSPDGLPEELWIGAFRIADGAALGATAADATPLDLPLKGLAPACASSAFILSPKSMPQHNVDEEPRADFLPLLEARDRFGAVVGRPWALVSYYAPSLAKGRFAGSHAYLFLYDAPLEALPAASWAAVVERIAQRLGSGLQVTACDTDYASYGPGERVRIRVRVRNDRPEAAACEICFLACSPDGATFAPITRLRRCPEGGSETEAVCAFLPPTAEGLWRIRAEVLADPDAPELLSVVGAPELVERREIGFEQIQGPVSTPSIIARDGPRIVIDGRSAFWVGTHYYPSSSWWDWVWRDYRPAHAASDFAAIRRAGYRIARIWADPILDETVLRAMDAAIVAAARQGIVLDICLFTQWTREMGFERASGEHVRWDFRDPRDFNLVSFSLRHLDLQREYAAIVAARWKEAGNVVFNLANEAYVKAPDATQMDAEAAAWAECAGPAGTDRDTRIFRRWAEKIAAAMRGAGAEQLIIPAYLFTSMDGGDNFLANAQADIVPWHSYLPTRRTASTLQYVDPTCIDRPLLLEEFGREGWNNAEHYDASAHYALAGGAAGAMSYEWGVSWLAREHGYHPLPLRESMVDDPDPRWFAPFPEIGKSWTAQGVSLCGTPSGTGYGSVYHGTPFVAEAAAALGRRGLMGEGLARAAVPETTYVVAPAAGPPQPETLERVEETLFALWRRRAVFGMWQEARLGALPTSVQTVICPAGVATEDGRAALEALRDRGVAVYGEGDGTWRDSDRIERVPVTPADGVDVLVRRTVRGTLYALSREGSGASVRLSVGPEVELGLDPFGLVQVMDAGVGLVEGAGRIAVDGALVCALSQGRAVIAAEGDGSVERAEALRICVTGPTTLTFGAPVAALAASDGSDGPSRAAPGFAAGSRRLEIDGELSRYVLHVTLDRQGG